MIAFVEGILEEAEPLKVVVNANGVGYELNVPLSSSVQLPPVGQKLRLHAQLVVREDSHTLYGFSTREEKAAFVALTEKVSGIGPKIALSILSRLSVESLQSAVSSGNIALLSQCPGIGRKTAERLILELKDLVAKTPLTGSTRTETSGTPRVGASAIEEDAIAALITLGFKAADAAKRVEKAMSSADASPTAESVIKKALNG